MRGGAAPAKLLVQRHSEVTDAVVLLRQVVRTLIQMTNVDGEKLALFREVAGVLAGVQQGTYPSRELEWLVSNCWNRGCHHNKFSR
jgi:hypothetical protein